MISLSDVNVKNIISDEFVVDLPELHDLKIVIENNIWHKESVFDHTLKIFSLYENALFIESENDFLSWALKNILSNEIDGVSKKDLFKLIILFHDIAKLDNIVFDKHGFTHCLGHEEIGYLKTKLILERFGLSASCREYILKMIKYHGIPHVALDNFEEAKTLLREKSKIFIDIYPDLLLFCLLDTMGSHLKISNPDDYGRRLDLYREIIINFD